MNAEMITTLETLRARLVSVEQAGTLYDTLEGQRPYARRAAVLLPIFEQDEQLMLLFIRRATTLRSHSGEIAFPGGSVDTGDTSIVMTALREAQEEIGLAPQRAEILGLLPSVFTVVSNFVVTPVVAFLPHGPGTLLLQESEVAELIVLPLQELTNPAIAHTEEWTRAGQPHTVHFFDYGSYRIWGATGRMLSELLTLLT